MMMMMMMAPIQLLSKSILCTPIGRGEEVMIGGGGGSTSKREPRAMYSMTMHILGALVEAAINNTTFGCLSAVITLTCGRMWRKRMLIHCRETVDVHQSRAERERERERVGKRSTSSLKSFSISLVVFSEAMTLTATSVPFHVALYTSP